MFSVIDKFVIGSRKFLFVLLILNLITHYRDVCALLKGVTKYF